MPSHRLIFPDGAYAAAITATVPARVQAGAVIEVPVQVRNDGDVTWPCRPDVLRLANHWLDEGGAIVVQDSGREPLPVEVRPGESVDLSLTVPVPTTPGRKVLELDLVHEGIAWFADRGSPTLRTTVEVVGGARLGWRNRFSRQQRDGRPTVAETAQPAKPVMEMYPVPREEVLALIANLGGTVAAVDHNDQAPPWESYTYYATKAATRSRNAL